MECRVTCTHGNFFPRLPSRHGQLGDAQLANRSGRAFPPRHQARSNRRELLPKSNPSAYGPCNVCRRAGQQRDTVKSAGEDLNLRHRPQTLTGVTAVLNLHRGLHQKRDGARITRQAFCPVPGVFHRPQSRASPQGYLWNMDKRRSFVCGVIADLRQQFADSQTCCKARNSEPGGGFLGSITCAYKCGSPARRQWTDHPPLLQVRPDFRRK